MAASSDNPLSANVVVRPGRLAEVMVGLAAGLGMFLAALDIALNVALPSIRSDFASDYQTVQWIIVVFIATRAGLVLTAGSLADRLGLRRVYLFGGVTYLASMVCIALSPNLGVLVGFRVLQALGTGCLYAVSPAIAASLFPESRRGLGMGLTSASQATGMLAGTLGAGLLVRWFDWEAVFLGRIPFTVLALALGVWWMGRGQRVSGERAGKQSFDLAGAVTLFGALTCLVIGLRLARSIGWLSPGPLALLLLAPLLLAGFWWTEGRVPWAILPRELLRIRGFLVSGGATFLAHLGVFVIWFIFPFYVEDSLGRGPAALGAMLAVMAGLNIGFSIMGGWLCDRTGPKAVGVTGLIVLAAGLFVMGFLEGQSTVGQVAASIALVGGGMGLFQSSAYSLMMGSVPAERFGTAAAALSLAQAFGTVLSVSVTGGLFALRSGFHLDGLAAGGLTPVEMEARAFILAFRDVFWLGAVIVVMGAFTYLMAGRRPGCLNQDLPD